MKSTSLRLPTFWVKVIPVVLMFFCIGLSSTQAQSFKPFAEAYESVDNAVEAANHQINKGGAQINSTAMSSTQLADYSLKSFEVYYFRAFLVHAKKTQDVALALAALDQEYNAQGQAQGRTNNVNAARADLLELITL
jgi:hypothetical protein